jgi:hypothetical protein
MVHLGAAAFDEAWVEVRVLVKEAVNLIEKTWRILRTGCDTRGGVVLPLGQRADQKGWGNGTLVLWVLLVLVLLMLLLMVAPQLWLVAAMLLWEQLMTRVACGC